MQHPRFALRAVRKRGRSIAGLGLRRDMLGRFSVGLSPAEAPVDHGFVCPSVGHLISLGEAALKGLEVAVRHVA